MIYIALLRGINVGGNNRVKMADLKRLFETIGFSRVQTYIQSGNVLFQSEDREEVVKTRIEHNFRSAFGYAVSIIMRTAEQVEYIAGNCPFSEEEVAKAEAFEDGESLYVALLEHELTEDEMQRLGAFCNESEQMRADGRDVYLLFYHSVRDSKLAVKLSKLDTPSTVRNWKTIQKLATLVKEMED